MCFRTLLSPQMGVHLLSSRSPHPPPPPPPSRPKILKGRSRPGRGADGAAGGAIGGPSNRGGVRGAASAASSAGSGAGGGGAGATGRTAVRNLVTPNKSMGQNFLKNPMIVQVRQKEATAVEGEGFSFFFACWWRGAGTRVHLLLFPGCFCLFCIFFRVRWCETR